MKSELQDKLSTLRAEYKLYLHEFRKSLYEVTISYNEFQTHLARYAKKPVQYYVENDSFLLL